MSGQGDHSWFSAWARRAVALYPSEFRALFASEMVRILDEDYRERKSTSGRAALVAFLIRTFVSVAAGVLWEWMILLAGRSRPEGLRHPRRPRRRGGWMDGLREDFRSAVRTLIHSRGFVLVAAITLALGIAVNTTIFSLVSTLLLRELPVSEPERFAFLWAVNEQAGERRSGLSYPEIADLREQSRSFEGVSFAIEESFFLTGEDDPARVTSFRVTDNFFDLWGIGIVAGRGFQPGDDLPSAAPVAVLSHGFWERRLGRAPDILGNVLWLDGEAHTIVGVLSPTMEFGDLSRIDLWVPLRRDPSTASRNERIAFAQVRLREGVSFDAAQRELDDIAARLQTEHRESRGWGFRVSPILEEVLNDEDQALFLALSLSVGLVLLMACANVANLVMVRSFAREKEFAIRLALGARRLRVVRQLLGEAVVLSLFAGVLGLVLTQWMLELLRLLTQGRHWIYVATSIDTNVLGFTLVVSLLTPLLFALWPAIRASRPALVPALKEGGRSGALKSSLRIRRGLVTLQVCVALVLMTATGLMVRSLIEMRRVELGFDFEDVISVRLKLPDKGYESAEAVRGVYRSLLDTAARLAGSIRAAVVNRSPFSEPEGRRNFRIEGRELVGDSETPTAYVYAATPGYVGTMGIPLVRGRDLANDDVTRSTVVLVNRAAVEKYWPNSSADPIGSRIQFVGEDADAWAEIVGVVENVAHSDLAQLYPPQIYLHIGQAPSRAISLVVRTRGTAGAFDAFAQELRGELKALDATLWVDDMRTFRDMYAEAFATVEAIVSLFVIFGVFALGMAAMGIYAVMSFVVSQREREIGIRMVLGAASNQVLRMLVVQGVRVVGLGILVGLIGALFFSRLVASVMFGVSATDPSTFVTVPLVLAAVALVANYAPARRATRVDPVSTLRSE